MNKTGVVIAMLLLALLVSGCAMPPTPTPTSSFESSFSEPSVLEEVAAQVVVWHDDLNDVTCYLSPAAMACIPDWQLSQPIR